MDLKACEHLFTNALDPACPEEQYQAACELLLNNSMEPSQQLQVYRSTVTGAQQSVLAIVYPVCQKILGENCFDALARDYSWDKVSESDDLNYFGHMFPAFLEQRTAGNNAFALLPYLPDLASLEWLWHHAHFTKNEPGFSVTQFQQLNPGDEELFVPMLSCSLKLMKSPYPVHAIWQNNKIGKGEDEVMMPDEWQYLCIYRDNDKVTITTILMVQYKLLKACMQQLSLSELIVEMGGGAVEALGYLPSMVEMGWITGFKEVTDG